MNIEDQFHHRLSTVESRLNKTVAAPTVPLYDIVVSDNRRLALAFARFWVPIDPDVDYLIEGHFQNDDTTSTFDWYLNGSLMLTRSYPSGSERFRQFSFGYPESSPDDYLFDAREYYYMWGLKIGTTRHGTSKWNDSLATSPTVNPYSAVFNPTYLGLSAWENHTLTGTPVQKVNLLGGYSGSAAYAQAGGTYVPNFNMSDGWVEFNINVPSDMMNWLESIADSFNAHFVIGELLDFSGSLYFPSGQISIGWDILGDF